MSKQRENIAGQGNAGCGVLKTGTRARRCGLRFLLLAELAAMFLANASGAQSAMARRAVAPGSPTKAAAVHKRHEESEGERVFAANCGRCHTAPDGFSQRISGTVVRHMRVRASLSEEDEKALLRFFNP